MSALVSWPDDLRFEPLLSGLRYSGPVGDVAVFAPETGPARVRRRTTAAYRRMSCDLLFRSLDELAAFEAFWRGGLGGGTADFEAVNPVTGLVSIYRPAGGGYQVTPRGRGITGVSMELMVLDEFEWTPTRLFLVSGAGAWFDPASIATLFQDSAGTTPVTAAGDPVGRAVDLSGAGLHATQATAASRPIHGVVPEGGRRNLLTYTEQFDNADWAFAGTGSELCSVEPVAAPDGTMTAARLTFTASSQTFRQLLSGAGDYTGSMHVRGTPGETISLRIPGSGLNLVHTLSGAWDRIERTIEADTLTNFNVNTFGTVTARIVDIWRPQVEAGTVATSYQRVGSQYDVTEAGVRSLPYLYRDGVDDALNATLPDLGTAATVAYASDQGVTIQTGQTIGAGAYDVLRDEKLFGIVVIDRALTATETASLTSWLEKQAGAYA